jgi:hypothetical protein
LQNKDDEEMMHQVAADDSLQSEFPWPNYNMETDSKTQTDWFNTTAQSFIALEQNFLPALLNLDQSRWPTTL